MPGDLRKVSLVAVVLIVLLRISIGWHLMYEGLWKLGTQQTSTPWTSEGYLKNSTGPLRPMFRKMTGDPHDQLWLDANAMSAKWNAWRERFLNHYQLDDKDRAKFQQMMTGGEPVEVSLPKLPPGLDINKIDGVNKKAIRFDPKAKKLIVDGNLHLLPAERDRLIGAAEEVAVENPAARPACDQFIAAVSRAYTLSSRLSFDEKLAARLKGDPERVGILDQKAAEASEGGQDIEPIQVGEISYYNELTKRFDANYVKARTGSEWDHIEKQWKELQDLRRKLVGPVQALEKEMKTSAEGLLVESQLAKGPVPEPMTPIQQIDWRTMWGLTIFGLLLMIGLLTRLSAIGGAVLLTLFYMAMPPWPGVQELPSIEHNLFINKVFVEMLALLAIAALPTGKWFGIDAAISALLTRRSRR